MPRLLRPFVAGLALVALAYCSTDSGFDTAEIYFSTMQEMTIDVYYEPGAEPFIGTFGPLAPGPFASRNYWDIAEDNFKALFVGRTQAVTVTVPKTLELMTELAAQNRTTWSTTQLRDLWVQHRKNISTATHAYFFLVFLNGNYQDNDGVTQTGVVGVNVGGTPVTAIFKDVVQSTSSNPNGRVAKYVEQSTIVHEIGHALGLVNNGIPLVSSHQDTAHGAHCSDEDCVMYYLNAGVTDLVNFVQSAEASTSLVLFNSDCLNDARGYVP